MTSRFKVQTKMITKPMLCAVVVGFAAMCSVTSAQVSRTNGYSASTSTEEQTVQGTGKKDLSEFGSRLSKRLGEVLQEVVGLVIGGVKQSQQQISGVPIQDPASVTNEPGQVHFTDIEGNPYAPAIARLAELGIVNAQSQKFYPDNYLRTYELLIMLVNAQMYANDETLDIETLAQVPSQYADVKPQASYASWVKYAQTHKMATYLTVASGGRNFITPNRRVSKADVYRTLGKATGAVFTYDEADAGQKKMTRGEFASLLVQLFNLEDQSTATADDPNTVSTNGSGTSLLGELRVLLSKFE